MEEEIILPEQPSFVYKGPTYQEVQEQIKSDPVQKIAYNQVLENVARKNNPTSEIIRYKDSDGNDRIVTNVQAGVLSPVDPVTEFYVAGKVLSPIFKLAGNQIANSGYVKYTKKYGLDRLEWKGLRGKNSYIELKPAGEWMQPIFMQSTKSGVGKKLYDAAIKYAQSKGYKGIKSGENLLSAPKTYSIWKHYPNKILIGSNGSHTNVNMYGKRGVLGYKKVNSPEELIQATQNGEKAVLENGNIYGLSSFNKNIYIKEKQGGKMNILQFLKSGSGIHIKKENRGKFTDYCGGKVTSECIAKGKRSSNPAIRKRATFAANARKWKHEDGGRVKKHQAFVNGVSILDSNPDAYKYVKKKLHKAADGGNSKNWFSGIGNWLNKNSGTISNLGNTAISTIANSVSAVQNFNNVKEFGKVNLEDAKAQAKKKKAQYKPYAYQLALQQAQQQTSGTEENISPIVIDQQADKIADMLANSESSINQVLAQNAQMESAASNNMLETITGGIRNGVSAGIEMLGMLGNKSSNNTSSTNTTSTTTSSTTPTYQPSYKYDMMAPYKKDFTFKI